MTSPMRGPAIRPCLPASAFCVPLDLHNSRFDFCEHSNCWTVLAHCDASWCEGHYQQTRELDGTIHVHDAFCENAPWPAIHLPNAALTKALSVVPPQFYRTKPLCTAQGVFEGISGRAVVAMFQPNRPASNPCSWPMPRSLANRAVPAEPARNAQS